MTTHGIPADIERKASNVPFGSIADTHCLYRSSSGCHCAIHSQADVSISLNLKANQLSSIVKDFVRRTVGEIEPVVEVKMVVPDV